MKQLLLLVFVLTNTLLSAQVADTSKSVKKKEPTAEELERRAEIAAQKEERAIRRDSIDKKFRRFSKDRFAIDLLGTNWIYNKNNPGMNGMQTKWYSRGINIYFYWDFRFKKSRVSFAPGIGYSATNIYNRHSLVEDSAGTHFEPLVNPGNYKVNKVTLQYVDIPLELRIKSNPDKFNNCWKVAIGFKAGIRVDAHTKQKIKDGNVKVYVERRFPDFSLFHAGPTLRVGYSSFNITAYYGVLDVFKKGLGPKANAFSVGISFNGL